LWVVEIQAGSAGGLRELQNRPSAFRPAEMIDRLAFLATEESARYAPALASTRHYLSGLRPHPKDRKDVIPDVQMLADRLTAGARPEHQGWWSSGAAGPALIAGAALAEVAHAVLLASSLAGEAAGPSERRRARFPTPANRTRLPVPTGGQARES
jgi:hypothetical protein